jgi:hypothetical protein
MDFGEDERPPFGKLVLLYRWSRELLIGFPDKALVRRNQYLQTEQAKQITFMR